MATTMFHFKWTMSFVAVAGQQKGDAASVWAWLWTGLLCLPGIELTGLDWETAKQNAEQQSTAEESSAAQHLTPHTARAARRGVAWHGSPPLHQRIRQTQLNWGSGTMEKDRGEDGTRTG
ncbi:hypothetical protein CDEST_03274 [Colletotrichum destructivum]|uniref:Uncharacterized protein n=1 Tax=Colletotrichum destructivum TaxID=34406 RepID=A0AAX4I4Q0_9PEZI|nr:hypothetical protein CDEST_03274 [Colletotrichum destructivum]